MVEKHFAEVSTLGEMIREVDLAPQRNMAPELVPSRQAGLDRFPQRFVERHHHLQFASCCLHRSLPSIDDLRQVINGDRVSSELCQNILSRGEAMTSLLLLRLKSFLGRF